MTRVVLHPSGFRALRNAPGVTALLEEHAQRIASSAGDGFEVKPLEHGNRARVAVVASSFQAKLAEAYHRSLTRAVGGRSTWRGRG